MKSIFALVLFSIGIIFAIFLGYNYFTTIHVISKQQAIGLALKYCMCSQQQFGNYTVESKLLQAKPSHNRFLIINDSTMSPTLMEDKMDEVPNPNFHEDQLVWNITIVTGGKYGYLQWNYYIDAINGNPLTNYREGCHGNCL